MPNSRRTMVEIVQLAPGQTETHRLADGRIVMFVGVPALRRDTDGRDDAPYSPIDWRGQVPPAIDDPPSAGNIEKPPTPPPTDASGNPLSDDGGKLVPLPKQPAPAFPEIVLPGGHVAAIFVRATSGIVTDPVTLDWNRNAGEDDVVTVRFEPARGDAPAGPQLASRVLMQALSAGKPAEVQLRISDFGLNSGLGDWDAQ